MTSFLSDVPMVATATFTTMVWAAVASPARASDQVTAALGDFLCYQQHWAGEEYTTPKIKILQGTMHEAGGTVSLYFKGDVLYRPPSDGGVSEGTVSKVLDGVSGVSQWEWASPSDTSEWARLHDALASGIPFVADLSSYRCRQDALTDPVYGPGLINAIVAEVRSLDGATPGGKLQVTIPSFSIRDRNVYVIGGRTAVYDITIRDASAPLNLSDMEMAGRPIYDGASRIWYRRIIRAGKHIIRE